MRVKSIADSSPLFTNSSVINYDQLYAQMMHKLRDKQTPYWFTIDEVARIQEFNQPSSR